MVLHNFVRAHEINNNVDNSRSTGGTSRRSERGHYDTMAHTLSLHDALPIYVLM